MILKRNKLTFQCKYNRDDGICQIFPIKKEKIAVKTIEKSANVSNSVLPADQQSLILLKTKKL